MQKIIKNKPIGIIGGMGPDASARLYQLMIRMARLDYTIKTNEDYPEIVLQSIPVPEFITNTDKANQAYLMIKDRVKKIGSQNLNCVGIGCNTAHMFIDKLRKESRLKFVSILEEVLKQCRQREYKRVGLLATPATHKLKLYEKVFRGSGIELVKPEKVEVKRLGRIAEKIVIGEINTSEKKLKKIADGMLKKGAEVIILGCTELPLAFPKNYQLPVLDSVEILAKSLLKRYYQ